MKSACVSIYDSKNRLLWQKHVTCDSGKEPVELGSMKVPDEVADMARRVATSVLKSCETLTYRSHCKMQSGYLTEAILI